MTNGGAVKPVQLEEWRRNNGLTQREAAERAGVHVDVWRAAEHGINRPRPKAQKDIAKLIGVQATDIWPVAA